MLKQLENLIRNERLIESGDRVLCAVSGGADSVALLVLLKQLSGRFPFVLIAAHLNHSLRVESGEDAQFVADLCAKLLVPLEAETIDIKTLSEERGEGLEATGRFARRRFFERVAQEQNCTSIALAHHADDQAETVLFRLFRGSGLTGLGAMRTRAGLYVRPLLHFRKAELHDWLDVNGIAWREDASNLDPAFSRNRIRNQILPELRQINLQVEEALCRFSQQVALEEEFWTGHVNTFLLQNMTRVEENSALSMSGSKLLAVHPAMRRRVLRGMLDCLRGDLRQIDAGHIDQIEALLVGSKSQSELNLPGAWIARRYDQLHMRLEPPVFSDFELPIMETGTYPLPNGECLVVTLQPAKGADRDVVEFCSEQVSFPLTVRTVRPGDRFQPSGMDGHKRLKDYFIDNKIPHESRRSSLVVCANGIIIWLVGERRCEGFRADIDKPVLHMRVERSVFVNE